MMHSIKAFLYLSVLVFASAAYLEEAHDDGENDHDPTHYSFQYSVNDPHTGDEKSHHEERYGDYVKGYYTVKEADGSTRHVRYTADKHNGFNAEVLKIEKESNAEYGGDLPEVHEHQDISSGFEHQLDHEPIYHHP